jgi:DNA processing protein
VTNGLSQGSIIVEAAATSGARMQARLAAEQGKRVWLLRSLLDNFEWARGFGERRPSDVRVVDSTEEVIEEIVDTTAIAEAAREGLPPVAEAEEHRGGDSSSPQFALF